MRRKVDRPRTSDTRQAFENYPVFQVAPFEAAAGAVSLSEDSTVAVADALDANGIGYAIAEQALGNSVLKIVPMHDTLPDDPRYPFSQPLAYVYNAANLSPAALAFLGYVTNPDNEAVIEAARQAAAADTAAEATAAEPAVTPAPTESAATTEPADTNPVGAEAGASGGTARPGGIPWWPWWLALPLLAGLLW